MAAEAAIVRSGRHPTLRLWRGPPISFLRAQASALPLPDLHHNRNRLANAISIVRVAHYSLEGQEIPNGKEEARPLVRHPPSTPRSFISTKPTGPGKNAQVRLNSNFSFRVDSSEYCWYSDAAPRCERIGGPRSRKQGFRPLGVLNRQRAGGHLMTLFLKIQ